MKETDKQSIFWYGLHKIAYENAQFKYYITTQKELISKLYPIVYIGVTQYTLYRGITINEIPVDELNTYTSYIMENYEQIYKIKYRFVKEKPKKLNFKEKQIYDLSWEIIAGLLLPYINEFCFKNYEQWKNLTKSYIRECAIIYEYDINHEAEDGKIKTSIAYPFIFTLNLIKIYEKQGLYQRIQKCYQKEILLKKFNSGREWKQKELDYLQETYELIQNDEEWSMFLSNFSNLKWDSFDLKERFKGLFQLTKLTTILMKDEISAVTMLDDGAELYELIENYLPLFIFEDKIKNSSNNLNQEYKNSKIKVLSPFNYQNINIETLIPYVCSKGERFVEIDKEQLKSCSEIIASVFSNLRMTLLIHEYLPQFIDSRIIVQKKLLVNVLKIFEEVKENRFKRKIDVENLLESDFFISEEEIIDIIELHRKNLPEFGENSSLLKVGKIMSLMLGIEPKTASSVNYDLRQLIKNILIIFGPHPLDHTVQTRENINFISTIFEKICREYEKKMNLNDLDNQFSNAFELPLKLLNWKKD
ncbi:hypothetical protein [Spiroplasma taiwanense]|uniref:Uncharacterized protein n=1 Tax=Spiroplasma taiwanense CT-1 TaxID=1276220 RepID=S5LZ49_9MOLU|nr:hypothetical protein [Spiroplasma taiwanense]AGR40977.1 hypothetical protein STAIW_v1c03190 [Spiroplasma taiwanense CT-1]